MLIQVYRDDMITMHLWHHYGEKDICYSHVALPLFSSDSFNCTSICDFPRYKYSYVCHSLSSEAIGMNTRGIIKILQVDEIKIATERMLFVATNLLSNGFSFLPIVMLTQYWLLQHTCLCSSWFTINVFNTKINHKAWYYKRTHWRNRGTFVISWFVNS